MTAAWQVSVACDGLVNWPDGEGSTYQEHCDVMEVDHWAGHPYRATAFRAELLLCGWSRRRDGRGRFLDLCPACTEHLATRG